MLEQPAPSSRGLAGEVEEGLATELPRSRGGCTLLYGRGLGESTCGSMQAKRRHKSELKGPAEAGPLPGGDHENMSHCIT